VLKIVFRLGVRGKGGDQKKDATAAQPQGTFNSHSAFCYKIGSVF
jgi:hypothetical protein